ncbi:hypothetical protein DBT42_09025 [Aerococcus urinae]|uniref:hypothetical protein n=1 Tax=Aerococcus urinae TaxID=1376 RepID=UPI000DCC5A30|nr:hypothetical protein [Aerococcus urinae]RAV62011.1 hypothetical protein DBT42_09025 [Aerococcus urinae]
MREHEVGLVGKNFLGRGIVQRNGAREIGDGRVVRIGGDAEDRFDGAGRGELKRQNIGAEVHRDDAHGPRARLRCGSAKAEGKHKRTDLQGRVHHPLRWRV